MPTKTILVLGAVISVGVFRAPVLTGYANLFRVDNASAGADLILILSGHPETRGPKAIDLYRHGYSDRLMVTNAVPPGRQGRASGMGQYDVLRRIASEAQLHITMLNPEASGATSTYDEALQAAQFVSEHDIEHLIVVTDAYHTARARYTFTKIFSQGQVHARVEFAAAEDEFNESNWWTYRKGVVNYLIEPVKLAYYAIR